MAATMLKGPISRSFSYSSFSLQVNEILRLSISELTHPEIAQLRRSLIFDYP
jgi:hypothetical protein